jgi:hypothetical protein
MHRQYQREDHRVLIAVIIRGHRKVLAHASNAAQPLAKRRTTICVIYQSRRLHVSHPRDNAMPNKREELLVIDRTTRTHGMRNLQFCFIVGSIDHARHFGPEHKHMAAAVYGRQPSPGTSTLTC